MVNININQSSVNNNINQNTNKIIAATSTSSEVNIIKSPDNPIITQQSINNVGITSSIFPAILSEYVKTSELISYLDKKIIRAWLVFDAMSVLTIKSSYNILSVIDNGVGNYTINFIQPFANSNYCFVTWARDRNTDNFIFSTITARSNTPKTASSITLLNNLFTTGVFFDTPEANIIFIGDQ